MKSFIPASLLCLGLSMGVAAQAASGQINSFSASATTVTEGTSVDFTVDFGVITSGWTNGGSDPFEPPPQEGSQIWHINWYSYEHETLTQVWFDAAGNGFMDYPSVPADSSHTGSWTFSVLFPTQGSFDITLNGGWTSSIESYHSNESATRECYNIDPEGTNELSCSWWSYVYDDGGDTYTSDGTFGSQTLTINVVAVPEPSSLAMLLAGLGVLGVALRQDRRRVGPARG